MVKAKDLLGCAMSSRRRPIWLLEAVLRSAIALTALSSPLAAQEEFVLQADALGAIGGAISGPDLRLTMTGGEVVVGLVAGSSPPETFTLVAGFQGGEWLAAGVGDESPQPAVVREFALFAGAPNPFDARTTIRYRLPTAAHVRLRIYDVAGRLVRVLRDGPAPPGAHAATWDGRFASGRLAPAGVYFCRLEAGEFSGSRALIWKP